MMPPTSVVLSVLANLKIYVQNFTFASPAIASPITKHYRSQDEFSIQSDVAGKREVMFTQL